jgi:hypothetical protein
MFTSVLGMMTGGLMSVHATVRALKENDEDFEWYPSTDEIIHKVVVDLNREFSDGYTREISVLDIGAGDGRVLRAIQSKLKVRDHTSVECFAIEKAIHHLSNMPKDITVIGTDFEQQTLVDKPMKAIFCNPPYSEFEAWMLKVVREASTNLIYLVVPRRWRDSKEIRQAIEKRSGDVKSLGEFDFSNADRRANAKVEIVRIEYSCRNEDAFNSMLEEMMPEFDVFDVEIPKEEVNEDLFKAHENLVESLVDSYDHALAQMLANYKAALKIDRQVLKELGIEKKDVLGAIRLKITGLKNRYWQALFNEMGTIKERLATKQRQAFLKSLSDKVTIDFTANNVYSILIWVSKWANDYFDAQLIELFQTLSNDSNVVKYKSNQRLWTETGWRYGKKYHFGGDEPGAASHYKLEYRMVVSHGGIGASEYSWERERHRGLSERAYELISDIVTVANNLGFPCKDKPSNYEWKSNKQNRLMMNNGKVLVAVRAFQNGNMHLHFDPKFMLAVNVEAGRLLKWIRNPAEACKEMNLTGDEAKQAEKFFGSHFRISADAGMLRIGSVDSAECAESVCDEEDELPIADVPAGEGFDFDSIFDEMFSQS